MICPRFGTGSGQARQSSATDEPARAAMTGVLVPRQILCVLTRFNSDCGISESTKMENVCPPVGKGDWRWIHNLRLWVPDFLIVRAILRVSVSLPHPPTHHPQRSVCHSRVSTFVGLIFPRFLATIEAYLGDCGHLEEILAPSNGLTAAVGSRARPEYVEGRVKWEPNSRQVFSGVPDVVSRNRPVE